MYPNLYFFLKDIFGEDAFSPGIAQFLSLFQTFGIFLVLAFVSAGIIVYLELKRKHEEGVLPELSQTLILGKPAGAWDLTKNALGGFLFGYKIVYILMNRSEFLGDAASVVLSSKGSLVGGIACAILLMGWKFWDSQRKKMDPPKEVRVPIKPQDKTGDLVFAGAISGILGAKLFAIFDPSGWSGFLTDPIGTLLSPSGLAVYGGLIVGFLFVFFYTKRLGIKPIHLMDCAAPAIMLAYGVGRMGCHFSGDGDWGVVNELAKPGALSWLPDWLWSYDYPNNVNEDGILIPGCEGPYCHKLPQGVWPTPVYETLMAVALFGVLWMIRKRVKIAGMLFFIYVIITGVERFFIERIRVNESYSNLATQAEIISVVLVLVGIVGCWWLWRREKK